MSLTVFFGIKPFHPAVKILKQGRWWRQQQQKNSFKNSLKLTRFIRALPFQGKQSPTIKKTLGQKELTAWEKFGKTEPVKKTFSNPLSYLQAMQYAPGSQLLWVVTCVGVSFDDAAVLVIFVPVSNPSSTLPYVTPIKLIGSPSWTLVVSILWSVVVSLSVIRRQVSFNYPRSFLTQQMSTSTQIQMEGSHEFSNTFSSSPLFFFFLYENLQASESSSYWPVTKIISLLRLWFISTP